MGRGGCNITAIQDVTGAHIDVDKQKDKNGERMITIRYSVFNLMVFLMYFHYTETYIPEMTPPILFQGWNRINKICGATY